MEVPCSLVCDAGANQVVQVAVQLTPLLAGQLWRLMNLGMCCEANFPFERFIAFEWLLHMAIAVCVFICVRFCRAGISSCFRTKSLKKTIQTKYKIFFGSSKMVLQKYI